MFSRLFSETNSMITRTQRIKAISLSHVAYNVLRSYLANRDQFVELNDTASKTLQIVTGVPQCSILGPLLFLI